MMEASPNTRTLRAVELFKAELGRPPSRKADNSEEKRLAQAFSHIPRTRKSDNARECFAAVLAFHDEWDSLPQHSRDPSREEERRLAKELSYKRCAKTLSAEAQDLLERIKLLESPKGSPSTGAQQKHEACGSTCEAARAGR